MRTESIRQRPYYRLPLNDIERWLNTIECRLGPDAAFANPESVTIVVSCRKAPPTFRFGPLPGPMMETLDKLALSFLVVMSDEGRRRQVVIAKTNLRDCRRGADVECQIESGVDWTSPQGAYLSMLVCSSESAPREPGLPFRKFTTLAARHITVNRCAHGSEFSFSFLSPDEFKGKGYHPYTFAIVEITADDLECESIEETNIRVLLHEDLKGLLALGASNKNCLLAQQVVWESLVHQIASVALEGEYPEGSLGQSVQMKLMRRLSGLARDARPAALRAATQGHYKLVESFRKP